MTDKIKHLVSKKKRRFIEDGFDLDLAYIKPNIIAMGFPSENLEGVYRNHLDDVHKFLDMKHKDSYKVYNLCSEKNYDPAKFGNRVSHFGFDDHNAPPFELMRPFCVDMAKWLDANSENVAIVHCKAGKGRTGVMICAYLLYKKYFIKAIEAMDYYADARTENKKGVTIPSQRRYITYFGFFARNNNEYVPKTILLNSVTFVGVPTFNSGTCSPSLIIFQTKVMLHKSKSVEVDKNQDKIEMDIGNSSIPICGDIRIDVFHKELFKKERMLVFWFNTYFLERGVTLTHANGQGITDLGTDHNGDRIIEYSIPKFYLDKANKDKKHKLFPESFAVRLNITIPRQCDNKSEVDGNAEPTSNKHRGPSPPSQQTPSPREPRTRRNDLSSLSSSSSSPSSAASVVNSSNSFSSKDNLCSRSPKPNNLLINNRNENSTFYIGNNERSRVISSVTPNEARNKKCGPQTKDISCTQLNQDFTRLRVNSTQLDAQNRLSCSIEDLARFEGRDRCSDDSDDGDDDGQTMTI